MADNKPAEAYKFDEKAFVDKVEALAKVREANAGKKNVNPFVWYNEQVQPLVTRYHKGERTKELFDALASVKNEVPVIDPNWKEEKPPVLPSAKRA